MYFIIDYTGNDILHLYYYQGCTIKPDCSCIVITYFRCHPEPRGEVEGEEGDEELATKVVVRVHPFLAEVTTQVRVPKNMVKEGEAGDEAEVWNEAEVVEEAEVVKRSSTTKMLHE